MSTTDGLKQVIMTEDGQQFDTKAEALDYLRRPKIMSALMKLTGDNDGLSTWLIDNQDTVEDAFDTGTIKRVTKSERNKLTKAVEAAVEAHAGGNKALAFIADNAEAIVETFRWPTVKRMNDEEKAVAAKSTLLLASVSEDAPEGNEELADWAIANKDAILECFESGKIKRKVSPAATEALTAYREKKAAEKVRLEAAKEVGEEEYAKVKAEIKAENDAEKKAKANAAKAKAAADKQVEAA